MVFFFEVKTFLAEKGFGFIESAVASEGRALEPSQMISASYPLGMTNIAVEN